MNDIYLWNSLDWNIELLTLSDLGDMNSILRIKSDYFWESLAQQICERIFNIRITPDIYLFGPKALKLGKQNSDGGIMDAETIIIETYVRCGSDLLTPPGRKILFNMSKTNMFYPNISISVEFPQYITLNNANKEIVHMIPVIHNYASTNDNSFIFNTILSSDFKRTTNYHYVDFNLLYVPLRHLVMEGILNNKCYHSNEYTIRDDAIIQKNKHYDDIHAYFQASQKYILLARDHPDVLVQELEPYINITNYHRFNENILNIPINSGKHDQDANNCATVFDSANTAAALQSTTDHSNVTGLGHFFHNRFEFEEYKAYILNTLGQAHTTEFIHTFKDEFISVECIVDQIHHYKCY